MEHWREIILQSMTINIGSCLEFWGRDLRNNYILNDLNTKWRATTRHGHGMERNDDGNRVNSSH